jgi:hypothetical protein
MAGSVALVWCPSFPESTMSNHAWAVSYCLGPGDRARPRRVRGRQRSRSDVEVREAIGDKFPKHIYHSIVCIGALIAHREPDHWAVDAVGAPHVGERTEKELITAFCDKIAALSPQLVTFSHAVASL